MIPHSPAGVGVVLMIAGAAVGVTTSLSLEDAAASTEPSTVEFCGFGAGAVSELPLAIWLMFFWVIWRREVLLGASVG